jgi:hypothetical protein
MAEPTNINIILSATNYSLPNGSLTAVAVQNTNTPIGPGYTLRWGWSGTSTSGFTLSVAYMDGIPLQIASSDTQFVNYNVSTFFVDTASTYYKVNTSNPITNITLRRLDNNAVITPNQNYQSDDVEAIKVEFTANPDTSINYAPVNPYISAIAFNNEPFVRTLTAALMQNLGGGNYVIPLGTSTVKWTSNTPNVQVTNTNGTPITLNNSVVVENNKTVVFYLTASTYNYTTEAPKLCSTILTVRHDSSNNTNTYTTQYDTYPDLNLALFANFENTNNSHYFYRLTNATPYTGTLSCYSPLMALTAASFQEPYYKGWYTLNNGTTKIESLTSNFSFARLTPRLSSAQVTVSAFNAPNSFQNWLCAHTFTESITAAFVPTFLSASFVGYPGSVFVSNFTLQFLNSNNFVEFSEGMFFYGEGHTDYIYLCATPMAATNLQYNWTAKTLTTTYPISAWPSVAQPCSSVFLKLSSDLNTNVTIPIFLHVTGNTFTTADPTFYFDDSTGNKVYYPYFTSTLDPNGNDSPSNNRLRENIRIRPYGEVLYTFDPGFNTTRPTFLPDSGADTLFNASLITDTTTNAFVKCADKYGEIWKWSSFENCDAFVDRPTTWASTQCKNVAGSWPVQTGSPGPYAKKWRREGLENVVNPLSCNGSPVTWNLSSSSGWQRAPRTQNSNLFYDFSLKVLEFGVQPLTINFYEPTEISVKAEQTIQCIISAQNTDPTGLIKSNDWKLKTTTLSILSVGTFATIPSLRLYTPNRFVLTGTDVQFQNLITQRDLITRLEINFDDNKFLNVDGSNLNDEYFNANSYTIPGDKTLTITAFTTFQRDPIVTTFPRIITALSEYDKVDSRAYRSKETPLNLPWPEPPIVGSNDWVTSDNINLCFKKLLENLEYLDVKSKLYNNQNTTYYGYLATPPPSAFSASGCLFWTWNDIIPFTTSLFLDPAVTWRQVLSASNATDTGAYFRCGRWIDHVQGISQIIPNCYQKHNLEWNWRARKRENSSTPVTWEDAKCDAKYDKKWYYEPSTSFIPIVNCDEGYWHTYIPGFDRYYNRIANIQVQPRCIYTGIYSKNNMLYTTQKTQIKLLSSDYTASYYDALISTDGIRPFSDIKNICLNSNNTIYVLDGILNQVYAYNYEPELLGDNWKLFTNWGGFAGRFSKTGFASPNDLHIDQLDNVWVCDTGNNAIKQFSGTGTWINTIADNYLLSAAPISLAVDSQQHIHVLTDDKILVYNYSGEFQYFYEYKSFVTGTPKNIIPSYNREVMYVATNKDVIKFFRNGVYYSSILKDIPEITNINGMYHDEFRNLLIITDDKILKYTDMMTIDSLKGDVSQLSWPVNSIYIHEDEYVQNWVYTKSFQRMWDNIEFFRNSLFYTTSLCKSYTPLVHGKEKMIFGQNEIVTAATINRNFIYLWENLLTLTKHFDPSCVENSLS